MTHRCHWTPPGSPFPTWLDFATEPEATLHALRVSRELGVEVAVIELEEDDFEARVERWMKRSDR